MPEIFVIGIAQTIGWA